MRIKKEHIILVTIISALTIYLILHSQDRTLYRLPDLPVIVGTEISKIEFSKQGSSIELRREADTWQISPQGYLADKTKVKNMLELIEKLSLTALVSESQDFQRYDLTEDKKITVRAWAGKSLKREFEVGKEASSFQHTFVKLSGDHRVYHAKKDFRRLFERTVDDLRDKSVLSFDKTEIHEIHITKDEELMVFIRKQEHEEESADKKSDAKSDKQPEPGTYWERADKQKSHRVNMGGILSKLSKLSCTAYIYDRKKNELKDPIYVIKLKGAKEYILSLFAKMKEDSNEYPAISSENHDPFMLLAWDIKEVIKDIDEMVNKPGEPKG